MWMTTEKRKSYQSSYMMADLHYRVILRKKQKQNKKEAEMTDKVHDKSCCNSLLKYCGVLKKKVHVQGIFGVLS